MDNDTMVAVTQADRDAAAALVLADGNQKHRAARITAGSHDEAPLVQAFARHRHQSGRTAPSHENDTTVAVTPEDVDAAIATFDGGLRRQNGERNARGYTTFYHPKDSMRAVLEEFSARHQSGRTGAGEHPDLAGHIADAVRDACNIVIGKVVSFDDSRGIANTILDRIRIANAEYAALSQSTAGEDVL